MKYNVYVIPDEFLFPHVIPMSCSFALNETPSLCMFLFPKRLLFLLAPAASI